MSQLSQQIQNYHPIVTCGFFTFDWTLLFTVNKHLRLSDCLKRLSRLISDSIFFNIFTPCMQYVMIMCMFLNSISDGCCNHYIPNDTTEFRITSNWKTDLSCNKKMIKYGKKKLLSMTTKLSPIHGWFDVLCFMSDVLILMS